MIWQARNPSRGTCKTYMKPKNTRSVLAIMFLLVVTVFANATSFFCDPPTISLNMAPDCWATGYGSGWLPPNFIQNPPPNQFRPAYYWDGGYCAFLSLGVGSPSNLPDVNDTNNC